MEDIKFMKSRCTTLEIKLRTRIGRCIRILTPERRVEFYGRNRDLIRSLDNTSIFQGFNWNPRDIQRNKLFCLSSDWKRSKDAYETYKLSVNSREVMLSIELVPDNLYMYSKEITRSKYYESFMNCLLLSVGLFISEIFEDHKIVVPAYIQDDHVKDKQLVQNSVESECQVSLSVSNSESADQSPESEYSNTSTKTSFKDTIDDQPVDVEGMEVLLEADLPQRISNGKYCWKQLSPNRKC